MLFRAPAPNRPIRISILKTTEEELLHLVNYLMNGKYKKKIIITIIIKARHRNRRKTKAKARFSIVFTKLPLLCQEKM